MNRVNRILILFLAYFVLLFNGLSLYFNRANTSGYFFERLGYLLTNFNTGDDILSWYYKTLPLDACFPITTSLITGIDIFDSVFLPILPTIGITAVFLLSRCFFDSEKDSILVSISIFLYVFALLPHLIEYAMSQFLFCFFIYSFSRYLTTPIAKAEFFVISLILFLAVKFFGPPMEMWILSFIFFFTIATFATARYNANLRNNIPFYPQLTYAILIFVICFSYNPKIYGDFLYLIPTPEIFLETLELFLGGLIFSTTPIFREAFVTSPVTPTPLRLTNTLYFILIALPLILIPIYHILNKTLVYFLIRDIKAIFAISLLIPLVIELILYGSIGLMPMRYFLLVYPIISMYWIAKLLSMKTFYAILVCLIVISSLSFALHQWYDLYREFPCEISGQSMTRYLGDNTKNGIEIMTDHHTYGSLRIFFGEVFRDPNYFKIRLYNSDRYAKIVGMNEDEINDFDYLIINLGYLDFTTYGPGKPGEIGWKHFEPLGKYYSKINSNSKLNNIYINNEFAIYRTNHIT